jgi:hypothetical protein
MDPQESDGADAIIMLWYLTGEHINRLQPLGR